jgi:hypothetical protein
MFTMNRATRMTRIDPKPMYNFLPIVISKTLHPYGSALCGSQPLPELRIFPRRASCWNP